MDDAVDLNGRDCGPLERRQQHPAQRVAQRHPETAFQGFGDDAGLADAVGAGFYHRLFRADEFVPISFNHGAFPQDAASPAADSRAGDEWTDFWTLNAPTLRRATAVVRHGGDVTDGGDRHAGRLQGPQRRLPA